MGVSGLLPLVKGATTNSHIQDYRGQRVAVDGYAWLHKAVFVCATELAKGQSCPRWITFLLSMVDMLLHHGISVTMVFDGAELPAKRGTESARALKRQVAFDKAQALEKLGKASEAYQFYCQSVDVSPRMAAEFIQVLRAKRPQVDVLVAPYEADAQLAHLSRNNLVDAVISEDSDCIPYGCHSIIFKLSRDGSCQSLLLSALYKSAPLRGFNSHQCQVMAVAAGCDYLPSVKNVGIKKAYELVARYKTATKTLRVMRMNNQLPLKMAKVIEAEGSGCGQPVTAQRVTGFAGVTSAAVSTGSLAMTTTTTAASFQGGVGEGAAGAAVPDPGPRVSNLLQYELDFFRALATFRHQVVFDPITRTTVHLEPIDFSALPLCLQCSVPESARADPVALSRSLGFVGELLSPEVAAGVADGKLHPATHESFNLGESTAGGGESSAELALRGMEMVTDELEPPAAYRTGPTRAKNQDKFDAKAKTARKKEKNGGPSKISQINTNSIQRYLTSAGPTRTRNVKESEERPVGKRKARGEEQAEEETMASHLVASASRRRLTKDSCQGRGLVPKAHNSRFFKNQAGDSSFFADGTRGPATTLGGTSTATLLEEHEARQRQIAAGRQRSPLSLPQQNRGVDSLGLDQFKATVDPSLCRSPRTMVPEPIEDFYEQSENFYETIPSHATCSGLGGSLFDRFKYDGI